MWYLNGTGSGGPPPGAHADTHSVGGGDELENGSVADAGTTASMGSGPGYARSDHSHRVTGLFDGGGQALTIAATQDGDVLGRVGTTVAPAPDVPRTITATIDHTAPAETVVGVLPAGAEIVVARWSTRDGGFDGTGVSGSLGWDGNPTAVLAPADLGAEETATTMDMVHVSVETALKIFFDPGDPASTSGSATVAVIYKV